MSNTTSKHTLKWESDTSEAEAGAKKLDKSFGKSMLTANLAAQAITAALSALANQLKAGVTEAMGLEQSHTRLRTAVKGHTTEVERNLAALQRQASAMEIASNVSQEQIQELQSLALNYGISADKASEYARAAISMGQASGKDATDGLRALLMAETGVLDRTLKLIPEFANLTAEELRNGDAMRVANERYGEFFGMMTEGTSGKMASFTTAYENLRKQIAGAVLESQKLVTAMGMITEMIGLLGAEGAGRTLQAYVQAAAGDSTFLTFLTDRNDARLTGTGPGADKTGGGGIKPKAKKRKKRSGNGDDGDATNGFDFGLSAGLFDDLDVGLDAHDDLLKKLAEREEAGMRHLFNQRVDVTNRHLADVESAEAASHKRRLEKEQQFADSQAMITGKASDVMMGMFTQATSAALDLIERAAMGQKVALDEIVLTFLAGLGKQLVAQGIVDMAQGVGRGLGSYGFDATAYGLMGLGAAEVAGGGIMMAGGLGGLSAIKNSQSTSGNSGQFSRGGSVNDDGPDSGRDFHTSGSGSTYNITVVGTLSDRDADGLQRQLNDRTLRRG